MAKDNVVYRREKIINMKKQAGDACFQCGYNKNFAALHFHHLNSAEKIFILGRAASYSKNEVSIELKKCVLLCANCHFELHNPQSMRDLHPDIPPAEHPTLQYREQVLRLRQKEGFSHKVIAEKLNISKSLVYKICKLAGIDIRSDYLEKLIQSIHKNIS